MAVTHKYTLLCDDVRQENNGKFVIVGLYTPDIVVPAVPFAMSSLCFFIVLENDTPAAQWEFSFKLSYGDNIISSGFGKTDVQNVRVVAIPLRLGCLVLAGAGRYTLTFDSAGNELIKHEFSVNIAVRNL